MTDELLPMCGHRHVQYRQITHLGGTHSDAWACTDCGREFRPTVIPDIEPIPTVEPTSDEQRGAPFDESLPPIAKKGDEQKPANKLSAEGFRWLEAFMGDELGIDNPRFVNMATVERIVVAAIDRDRSDPNNPRIVEMFKRGNALECVVEELRAELDEAKKRIAELEDSERWIPVEERLPDTMDYYICRMDVEPDMGPRIDIVFYGITGWGEPALHGWANNTVTHWRPLPQLPIIPEVAKP